MGGRRGHSQNITRANRIASEGRGEGATSNRFRHADAGRHPRQLSLKRIDVAHVVEPLELSDRAIVVDPGLRRDDV